MDHDNAGDVSGAGPSRISIGRQPVGEVVLWLVPLALALMGHLYAWPKAYLSETGPGWRILIMNEETVRAQEAWRFLNSNWLLFVAYGAALMTTCLVLKVKRVWWPVRFAIFAVMAVPGLWYYSLASYLGGKFLGL